MKGHGIIILGPEHFYTQNYCFSLLNALLLKKKNLYKCWYLIPINVLFILIIFIFTYSL